MNVKKNICVLDELLELIRLFIETYYEFVLWSKVYTLRHMDHHEYNDNEEIVQDIVTSKLYQKNDILVTIWRC